MYTTNDEICYYKLPNLCIARMKIKGIVHPKKKDFCSSSEHKLRYFLIKSESWVTPLRDYSPALRFNKKK